MSSDSTTSSTIPNVPPKPPNVRPELISTAVNFLKDPQVKSAPLSKRLAFLESKGLSSEEINLAIIKSGVDDYNNKDGFNSTNIPSTKTETSSFSFKNLILTTAVVIGTGSLLLSNYQTIKEYFITKKSDESTRSDAEIKRVERELKESIKELKESMEEKEKKLQETLNELLKNK